MKVMITQSNYIPWKGFFDSLALVDCYVVFDEMQYTRRDWRNRNQIKTPEGKKWLTIPVEVKGKFLQKINETIIADANWGKSHWGTIKHYYSKSKYFKEIEEWLKPLYLEHESRLLTEVNLKFIQSISSYLGIQNKIYYSKDFILDSNKTQRLVDICLELGANEYYTGSAAKNYMEEEKFAKHNISVHYFDYSGYSEYKQSHPPFDHHVSILDLLFCEGPNAGKYLKYTT